jgi:small subunit ribosomal protein S17
MAKPIVGTVSSNKTDKTIVVTVVTRKTHPLYKKQYSVSTKFMAHDEKNEAEVGDKVSIVETRPLSARKRHRLEKVIEKALIREDQTVEAITADDDPIEAKEEES